MKIISGNNANFIKLSINSTSPSPQQHNIEIIETTYDDEAPYALEVKRSIPPFVLTVVRPRERT